MMVEMSLNSISLFCASSFAGAFLFSGCAVVPEPLPSTSIDVPISQSTTEAAGYEPTISRSENPGLDGDSLVSPPPPPESSLESSVSESPKVKKRFPPLIYGAPKPLVCSKEFLPRGKLKPRPNLQLMWEHYLYDSPKGVWAEIGGAVELNGCLPDNQGGWRNACTVRLSHMLNNAGHKIPYIKEQTVSGRDGAQYFFRLNDAQTYLEKTLGEPDLDIGDASGRWIDIPNEPGLLIMKYPGSGFTGHATIWNGAGTVDGTNVVGFRVLFWKLPCFIPPDRNSFL